MTWIRGWIGAMIMATIAVVPFFYLVYANSEVIPEDTSTVTVQFVSPRPATLEVGNEYNVIAARVIDGYRFSLLLDNQIWIDAHLSVATKESATAVVVDWMNKAKTPPVVILRRNVSDYWIVDFHLNKDGRKSNLLEFLKSENYLLY